MMFSHYGTPTILRVTPILTIVQSWAWQKTSTILSHQKTPNCLSRRLCPTMSLPHGTCQWPIVLEKPWPKPVTWIDRTAEKYGGFFGNGVPMGTPFQRSSGHPQISRRITFSRTPGWCFFFLLWLLLAWSKHSVSDSGGRQSPRNVSFCQIINAIQIWRFPETGYPP